MTELVIKTIHKNTPRDSFRLVVLDNASEPETVKMLNDLADNGFIDELFCIKTNIGLEPARNFLLREATESERFVCIDNDCLPPPPDGQDWLEKMNELFDKYEEYAAISMRTDPMIGTGNIFEEADKNGEELVEFPHPGGSFRIMRTDLTRLVGGWDRESPGRGQEERYICGKLRERGFFTGFATFIRCLHLYGPVETTDRWGYSKDLKPEDTGHSDIFHPKFTQGDDPEEVKQYSGDNLAKEYLDDNGYNPQN